MLHRRVIDDRRRKPFGATASGSSRGTAIISAGVMPGGVALGRRESLGDGAFGLPLGDPGGPRRVNELPLRLRSSRIPDRLLKRFTRIPEVCVEESLRNTSGILEVSLRNKKESLRNPQGIMFS